MQARLTKAKHFDDTGFVVEGLIALFLGVYLDDFILIQIR